MSNMADFFFALFNCPETHKIRVENGNIFASGNDLNLGADRLKMDLVNGNWVNQFGVKFAALRIPPRALI